MSTEAPGDTRPPGSSDGEPDPPSPPQDQRPAGRLFVYLPIAIIVLLVAGAAVLVATGSSSKQTAARRRQERPQRQLRRLAAAARPPGAGVGLACTTTRASP